MFVQSIIPLPQSEMDIRRHVYRTKHSERRLPFDVRFPFIDETESWAYEILFVYHLYILTYFSVCAASILNIMPVPMIHLRGQYEILCKYINLIGEEHRDAAGNAIYYKNIKENHYDLLFSRIISPLIMLIVFLNNLMFVLCLYQLVMDSSNLSPIRYYSMTGNFIALMVASFSFCNTSEITDDCNIMMVNAIKCSSWHKATNQTRRYLCIILRRVQLSNHLSFYEGMIILSRYLFLRVVRVGYSFVNFMKSKNVGN
ncbi:hypothetical protein WDU94_000868 [Cyamophila willieti]